MGWALVVDDISILLLVTIIALLAVSIYSTTRYQPKVHPLLLSRQADVSTVRRKGESAVYRNANAPAGFDLASQPRKAIQTVADAIRLGSGAHGWSAQHKRSIYGVKCSNEDILGAARAFAHGLRNGNILAKDDGSSAHGQPSIGVSVEIDSLQSLQVILSGDAQAGTGGSRFAPLVIAPAHLKGGEAPIRLPDSTGKSTLDALFTTANTLRRAVDLSAIAIIDECTVLIVRTQEEVEEVKKITPKHKVVAFAEVAGEGTQPAAADSTREDALATHSIYWSGKDGWVTVSNASLIAGLSAHLAMFPAESQPTARDRVFVEQSPYIASPSLRLGAGVTPAGLVLALLALYSGAELCADVLSSSLSDPNPTVSADFAAAQPTIIYASPTGASSLAACLCTILKRSPLAWLSAHGKLVALRHGVLSRHSIWDRLLFDVTRQKTHTTQVRLVALVGEGPTVGQGLLDIMRAQLGCAIRSMYLPASPLRASDAGKEGSAIALPTAPISATHSYDLQAFAGHLYDDKQVPAHVGPPSVAVEMKLVETATLQKSALSAVGVEGKSVHLDNGRANDPIGEIYVRGTTLASTNSLAHSPTWYATGDIGAFRSNGTLVVIRDQQGSEAVDVPTLSAEYPTLRSTSRMGAGGAATRSMPKQS